MYTNSARWREENDAFARRSLSSSRSCFATWRAWVHVAAGLVLDQGTPRRVGTVHTDTEACGREAEGLWNEVTAEFGCELSPEKTQSGQQIMTLGVSLDLASMSFGVDSFVMKALQDQIEQSIGKHVPIRDFQSLVGRATYVSSVLAEFRLLLRRAYGSIAIANRKGLKSVRIGGELAADLGAFASAITEAPAPDWGDTGSLAADATAACGEAAPPAAGAGATGGDSLSAALVSSPGRRVDVLMSSLASDGAPVPAVWRADERRGMPYRPRGVINARARSCRRSSRFWMAEQILERSSGGLWLGSTSTPTCAASSSKGFLRHLRRDSSIVQTSRPQKTREKKTNLKTVQGSKKTTRLHDAHSRPLAHASPRGGTGSQDRIERSIGKDEAREGFEFGSRTVENSREI
eukprot:scaffold2013_cov264-Pinguiococcus_pyrenoidosus.AAC.1